MKMSEVFKYAKTALCRDAADVEQAAHDRELINQPIPRGPHMQPMMNRRTNALARLESNYSKYICHAIVRGRNNGHIPVSKATRAMNIIALRIDGHFSYETWLMHRHGASDADVMDMDKMQASRHAWLDSLIAEYTSYGD